MTSGVRRRDVLAAFGAGLAGLAGCAASPGPDSGGNVARTVYVGSYHWGFVVLDENGAEQDRIVLRRGETVRLVAFNTSASRAVESLPAAVRDAVPDHEALEERNEERIPLPAGADMHDLLEEANAKYPDHSLAIVPSGQGHMRGGAMLHPAPLPHDARRPAVGSVRPTVRGDYTLSCFTYCGYGHPYMEVDGGFVVV